MNARWVALLVALWLADCAAGERAVGGATASSTGSASQDTAQVLGAEGTAQLTAMITNGRLPDLRWPDFSDRREGVQGFYTAGNHRLGWIRGGTPTPQALELIGLLENADQKGLDPGDYDGPRWPGRIAGLQTDASESNQVRFDVALTVSAVRYLRDLHLGKVSPTTLHKDFDPERKKRNAGVFLWENVTEAASVQDALARVEPPFPGYARALAALQEYMKLAKVEVEEPLAEISKPIEPGKSYSDLPKLVHRLRFLGDLPATATVPEGSQIYSGEAVDGVKRFQARHGLEAAGKLGPQTITELNRPMSYRVEQLRMTLERWRWVPHEFPEAPIVVNIPEFTLRAYEQPPGNATLMMPVVVGRAMRTQTPVMEEDMKYVVFWPYWNVPPSILRNEIVPKIAKDPEYLAKNSYEVTTYSGQVVTDGTVSEDVLAQLRAGKMMVRQKPGPKNALGLIKFIFPNDNNVYLHSTPSQAAFSQTRRDFSHGCIRVEDPQALAVWVLRNNPGWTKEKVEEAFKAQKERQVNLMRTIPVLIVYGTAVVKEDGRAYFFDDIYGFDKELARLTASAYSSRN